MAKKKKVVSSYYEAIKTHRGDWNGLNPITRIIPDKKKYIRKNKHKNKNEEE